MTDSISGGPRPLIVIPARFSENATALRYRAEVTARALLEAVFAAGGEPVVVHPYAPDRALDVDAARERIWFADGVLLPGGGDVAARWSGQQPHPTQYGVDEEQDAFDLAVARVALADRLPLLAICRGTQIVNVSLGGDLVQDMDDTVGNHRNRVHDLEVDEASRLGEIVGRRTAISVLSPPVHRDAWSRADPGGILRRRCDRGSNAARS
jgi:putative glutamine amidotransferase